MLPWKWRGEGVGKVRFMKVLLTGAFGNIGGHTLAALLDEGHQVRCFDIGSRGNHRAAKHLARRHGDRIEVAWGDLRSRDDVARAVAGQEAIVHLAFIIPKQSCVAGDIDADPEWAREINVEGTRHLIDEAKRLPVPPRFLFASSVAVYGLTKHLFPPRRADDQVNPVDAYGRHKVACEELVRSSGLPWTILRLGAAMPMRITNLQAMFDVPLDTRMEFVDPRDAARAFARAVGESSAIGKILLVGGGARCQFVYGDMVRRILEATGVGMLPAEAYTTDPFYTDWLDTGPSQALLHYQRHDLDDYTRAMRRKLGLGWVLARIFQPLVQRGLLRQSPHWQQARAAARSRSVIPSSTPHPRTVE